MDQLAKYHDEFSENLHAAEKLASGLTDEQFCWRPSPQAWSPCENLLHLVATGRQYMPGIDNAIQQARAAGLTGPGSFRHTLLERAFMWMMEPPVRLKMKTPNHFTPAGVMPKDEVMEEFRKMNQDWLSRLEQARGLDLNRIKLPSPANDKLKISLGAAFAVNAAHERRHLWQARQVIGHSMFPKNG